MEDNIDFDELEEILEEEIFDQPSKDLEGFFQVTSLKRGNQHLSLQVMGDVDGEIKSRSLLLQGIWKETRVDIDDSIFVKAVWNDSLASFAINDSVGSYASHLFIVEPKILVTASNIRFAFPCLRKSIFFDYFKDIKKVSTTAKMLVGTIVHELFETCLKTNSASNLKQKLKEILPSFYLNIAYCEESPQEVFEMINALTDQILFFYDKYIERHEKVDGLQFSSVKDTEKTFQSISLGLKGIIDVLLVFVDANQNRLILPLELKTGSSNYMDNDMIQVIAYSLLLTENVTQSVYAGVLFYLKDLHALKINVKKRDIVNVILMRNNLAKMLKNKELGEMKDLPDLLRQQNICENCFARDFCYSHRANIEGSEEDRVENYRITGKPKSYLKFYMDLINQEEQYNLTEYNKLFYDISDIKLEYFKQFQIISVEKVNYTTRLKIIPVKKNVSFFDYCLLVIQPNQRGFKGTFVGEEDNCKIVAIQGYVDISEECRLYLKPYDFIGYNYKLMRGNLFNLFKPEIKKLRKFVIDSQGTRYLEDKKSVIDFINTNFNQEYLRLNKQQKLALIKCLVAVDYSLVIGYPGSGKTKLITLLARILVKAGKKVLISANTHFAVDNVLYNLLDARIDVIRVASNKNKVDFRLRECVFDQTKYESVPALSKHLRECKVFGVTASGIGATLLSNLLISQTAIRCRFSR